MLLCLESDFHTLADVFSFPGSLLVVWLFIEFFSSTPLLVALLYLVTQHLHVVSLVFLLYRNFFLYYVFLNTLFYLSPLG